jgi:HlyD family secretion protein
VRDPHGHEIGPQGAALILELQRLRRAFELESLHDSDSSPGPAGPGSVPRKRARQPQRPQQRRAKGKIGRAFVVCLEQLGFNSANAPATGRKMAPTTGKSGVAVQTINPNKDRTCTMQRYASSHPDGIVNFDPIAMEARRRTSQRDSAELQHGKLRDAENPSVEPGDAKRDGPRDHRPPVPVAIPQARLPAREVQAATAVGRLIDIGRSGVVAGFALLAGSDGSADNDNVPGESLTSRAGRSFERELRTGLRVLLVALILGGGWLALMPLSGAVVVPGNLVVQSNVKTIQHPTGGIVAEIPVHDGTRVKAGDLLLRLDATQAQASLQVVSKQLDELRARIARLIAERDGLDRPEIPPELAARASEEPVARLLASEQSLFKARSTARRSQRDLLQSRVAQLGEEISGLDAQVNSKVKQIDLITGELGGVQDLYDKRLVPLTRLTTLQREAARIEGERGQMISTIAETRGKIDETQLQILRLDQDFRTDVVKELGETRAKEAELSERGVAARDMLDRIELRAPTSGVIHQLSVHTIGGVIRAGDVLMEVVPDSDDLLIEARLQPNDIDQVRAGQNAFVRFSAFNQRVTPQLAGTVSYVSADTSRDQQTNAPYYSVKITLPEDERHRMAGLQLISGMPAEVFMQTGSRTMLSYLLKPITDQIQRAFVER